jgi:hypothetical protein
MSEISPDKVILTTDYFFEWAPPASETMRMLIGSFLMLGMPEEHIKKMVRTNPARLLGLTEVDLDNIAQKQAAQALVDGRPDF